jgi:hypothetical protein
MVVGVVPPNHEKKLTSPLFGGVIVVQVPHSWGFHFYICNFGGNDLVDMEDIHLSL